MSFMEEKRLSLSVIPHQHTDQMAQGGYMQNTEIVKFKVLDHVDQVPIYKACGL